MYGASIVTIIVARVAFLVDLALRVCVLHFSRPICFVSSATPSRSGRIFTAFVPAELRAPLVTLDLPFADKLAQGLGMQVPARGRRSAAGAGIESDSDSEEWGEDDDLGANSAERAGAASLAGVSAGSSR